MQLPNSQMEEIPHYWEMQELSFHASQPPAQPANVLTNPELITPPGFKNFYRAPPPAPLSPS